MQTLFSGKSLRLRLLLAPTLSLLGFVLLGYFALAVIDANLRRDKERQLVSVVDGAQRETLAQASLFQSFVQVVERHGQGFVAYAWPKPRKEGGVTQELYPKLSHVAAFEPWRWVVGTGVQDRPCAGRPHQTAMIPPGAAGTTGGAGHAALSRQHAAPTPQSGLAPVAGETSCMRIRPSSSA